MGVFVCTFAGNFPLVFSAWSHSLGDSGPLGWASQWRRHGKHVRCGLMSDVGKKPEI